MSLQTIWLHLCGKVGVGVGVGVGSVCLAADMCTIHIIESNKVSCNITVQPHWTPVLIWVGHDCVH